MSHIVKDLTPGTVFIYEGVKFVKLKTRKRSHQRPYAVNAKTRRHTSNTVGGGWIPEDAEVIVVEEA